MPRFVAWISNDVKYLLSFYIFLTVGASVAKPHLIKTMSLSVSKLLLSKNDDSENSRIFLLDPTEVAAVNVNYTTIHSGLGIEIYRVFCQLNDKQRVLLWNILSEVEMVIIDEILMVSRVLFFRLNHRLNAIFSCDSKKAFAGLPVIICGELYQLPPVMVLQFIQLIQL